jgi:NAD(P)-dependent dehydrogenase (short-subunit alcohol dehydrogenase family)
MTRQLVQRHLARPGDEQRAQPASVIHVSSVLGMTGAGLQGVYGMTKAALLSLTQTLAMELGPSGVRVNAIAPGVVDTRLAAAMTTNDTIRDRVLDRTPLGRIGEPADIAGIAVFLASDEAAWITGQTFVVDGGYLVG